MTRDWLISSAYLAWAGLCFGLGVAVALVALAALAKLVGGV